MDEALKLRAVNQIFKVDALLGCSTGKDASFTLDFEAKEYRQRELVGLIRDTVPFFALTEDEIASLERSDWNKTSFNRISDAQPSKKGDYGELLLYIILSVFYDAPKFVTKARLRSSTREQIKGFDCAHFSINDDKSVTLWLGEAKFHQSVSGAIASAFLSINEHFLDPGKIKSELRLLGGEIEINKKLSPEEYLLLKSHTGGAKSLDKVSIRVPVLITYDSKCISDFCGRDEADIESGPFKNQLLAELTSKFESIYTRAWPNPKNIVISFYLLPLKSVSDLKATLDLVETAMKF
jgi:hypothetical protein